MADSRGRRTVSSTRLQRLGWVAQLDTLKAVKLCLERLHDCENTRDAIRTEILNFPTSDQTWLPVDAFTEEDVTSKTDAVLEHGFRAYPTVPSPFYGEAV